MMGVGCEAFWRVMSGERLHGVLVTFKRPEQLEATLDDLEQQGRALDTLTIVDNDPEETASTVVTRYAAVARNTHVEYVPTGDNLGPAGGIALGMRHVLTWAVDEDWVVLLDDDDPPRTTDMLAVLAEFGTSLRAADPTVGAVGKSGTRFDMRRARTVRVPDDALTGAVPSDYIGGCQLPFCSVHAIRAVGVFDGELFFGFDDLEYGLRLSSRGFRIFVHGGLWYRDRAYHGRLKQSGSDWRLAEPAWRRYYSVRNLTYILMRRGHRLAALRLAVRSLVKPVCNIPRQPRLAAQHLLMTARAIGDAYGGRMGRTVEPVSKHA